MCLFFFRGRIEGERVVGIYGYIMVESWLVFG